VNGGAVSGNYLAGGIAALVAESDISRCFAGGSVRAPLTAGLPPAASVVHLAEWGRVTDCYYLENEGEAGAGAGNLSPAVVAAVTPLTAEQAQAAAELSRLGEFTGPAPEWTFRPEWAAGPLPGGVAAIFPGE
jgi:hypothetical protein